MEKPQPHRMKALALETRHGLFRPVHRVPQNGVADVRHVDPDLVGAPGLQSALHIGIAGEPLQHGPVGHRAPAARHHRHLLPVRRVAADGGVHRAAVLPEIPDHDAPVNPGQGVVLKLGGELLVGEVVFRRDEEAGGVPVDPVDDAGPQLPPDAGEGVPAVVEQGVDQRAVRVAGGRMDHQPLGLVHHDHVAVLVHHIQGDVLGRHVHRLRVRQGNGHGLSPAQAVVFRQGLSGSGDPPLLAQPGGGGAGHIRQLSGQPGVQPGAGVLRIHLERPRLHGPCLSCRISRRTIGNRLPPARRRTPRRCPPR